MSLAPPPDERDELLFAEEEAPQPAPAAPSDENPWKILVADDEEDVHAITHLTLDDQSFQGRPLRILDTYSAEESRAMLEEHPDIAVILLDVVMETNDAGLRLADQIRTEMVNPFVRIVLRTGQPGEAPEREVIVSYGIDDYKLKTELTANKLFTVIFACLRTYEAMLTVDDFRKRMEEKVRARTRDLVESQRQLEQANAARDRFFSIFTHDLSNPFTAVHTMAELLKDNYTEFDDEARLDIVRRMHESSTHIYGLLHSLLEWSRTQTGRIAYEPQPLDLAGVVNETAMLLSANAHQKNIDIVLELPPQLEITADERMLATIVRNLLSNAIKFTHPGGNVTLSARARGDQVVISVADHGVGMSEETKATLFELDSTHTKRGTADEKGTGLGLLVCKEFVDTHGGRIDVESEEGTGSTFRVTLPRVAPAPASPAQAAPH